MRETYPAVTNDAQAEAAVRVFICFAKAKYPELTFGEVGNIVTRADEGGRIVRARTPVTAGGSDYLGIRLTFDKDGKLDYVGFHAPKVGTTR